MNQCLKQKAVLYIMCTESRASWGLGLLLLIPPPSCCNRRETGGSTLHNVRADIPSFLGLLEGVQEPFPIHELRCFYRQLTICLSEANLRDVLCRSLFTLEYWLTTIPKYLIGNPRVAVVNFSGSRDFKFAAAVLYLWVECGMLPPPPGSFMSNVS